MKPTNTLQNTETGITEPDFTQGDADAKPPLALQEKEQPFFYTVDDLRNLPDPDWLIQDILAEDGICAVVGSSKAGKSFFAIELAFCVARGEPFFGYETKKSPVAYLCFEGQGRFKYRFFAWEKEHNEQAPDNLFIKYDYEFFNLAGKDIAKLFPNGCLTIVDTLSAAAPKIEENGSGMKEIVEKAKEISTATGGAVLIIHHMGKDEKLGSRGHSSFPAGIDTEITIIRKGDSRNWKVTKNRDGEEGITGNFTLRKIQVGVDKKGRPITSCVIEPCEASKPIEKKLPDKLDAAYTLGIELCNEAGTNEISTEKWRLKVIEKLAKEKVNQRNYFLDAKSRLLDTGLIAENNGITTFYPQVSRTSKSV